MLKVYFLVIAITEGGVIPATLVYLGGFYKSNELATRLAWFWGVQVIVSDFHYNYKVLIITYRTLRAPLVD